jgi:hypothetical protein
VLPKLNNEKWIAATENIAATSFDKQMQASAAQPILAVIIFG